MDLWIAEGTRVGTFLKNYFGAAVKNRGSDFIYFNFKTGKLGAANPLT